MPSILALAAGLFGTIFLGFGANAILRPDNALSFFELEYPTSAAERNMIDALMVVYGVRDIFMGLAIFAAALFGNRKTMGCILLAVTGVAVVDGYVCKTYVGKGEMNHFSYAPMVALVGIASLVS